MRRNRKFLVLGLFAMVLVGAGLLVGRPTDALTPWPDRVVGLTSLRIDYVVPANAPIAVTQDAAIGKARLHTRAPTAVVHSARLAFYNDLSVHGLLVWVVDLDGINLDQLSGPMQRNGAPAPREVTTRAVVFVSATQPDFVVGMLTSNLN